MEFFNAYTDNEENRRLGEGNAIACVFVNFGVGNEFCCSCHGAADLTILRGGCW